MNWTRFVFFAVFCVAAVRCTTAKTPTVYDPLDKQSYPLDTEHQHEPYKDFKNSHLRPPKPMLPKDRRPTVFIGIAAFRDGVRCGRTLYTAFKQAEHPTEVYIGVVGQTMGDDPKCLDEYCKLAEENQFTDGNRNSDCPYKDHIRVMAKDAADSRGPTTARSWQQALIKEEDFCLQIDSHSVFESKWDTTMINHWKEADNEMAVLSTYITDFNSKDTWPRDQHPHLCKTVVGAHGMVRNDGASIVGSGVLPQLSSLWGAGLSFGKCHSEKRVPLDPKTYWIFDGEEYMKSSRLFTAGYDIYTPMFFAVSHDYSKVPHRFEFVPVDAKVKEREQILGQNRMKKIFGMKFSGPIEDDDIEKYTMSNVRSFGTYKNYSGVLDLDDRTKDETRCRQLQWVPYENPEPVRELIQRQLANGFVFDDGAYDSTKNNKFPIEYGELKVVDGLADAKAAPNLRKQSITQQNDPREKLNGAAEFDERTTVQNNVPLRKGDNDVDANLRLEQRVEQYPEAELPSNSRSFLFIICAVVLVAVVLQWHDSCASVHNFLKKDESYKD